MRIAHRRISRKLILIVAPIVLVLVGAGAAFAATSFSDIAGNTHEQSIMNMADRGVTSGYPDGTFRPNQPVTRGQMMTFLDRYQSGIGCTDCHVDGATITAKAFEWEESLHGSGTSAAYAGGRGSCTGCHSGASFSKMIAAGQNPSEFNDASEVTRQDCRTCHEIHITYTGTDWALETTVPVALYALGNQTFDGGDGNLCANCHQPRRDFPAATNGIITGISEHWGPHHGPQSAMLLGKGGSIAGNPAGHYTLVSDTCVSCHAGNDQHSFEPVVAACTSCHPGATNFDINGLQTDVQDRLDAIGDALVATGALSENSVDGHPTQTAIDNGLGEDLAKALWIWLYIAHEDKSLGVHNPGYAKAMLDAAEDALGL